MGKKRSRKNTPEPRRKSDRKRKRTAKGEYYDENLHDCTSSQADSPPAPETSVSVAVEKGDISTILPPVPEQTLSDAVEKGTLSPPVPEQTVSVAVEKGDISTISPPAPEQTVSVAVEEGDKGEQSHDCDATVVDATKSLRRSEIPILHDIATPVLETSVSNDENADDASPTPLTICTQNISDSTPSSDFATPVRDVRRTKSLNLKEELAFAESFRLSNEGDEENDISELKDQEQEHNTRVNDEVEWSDGHYSWKILDNVYELLHYPSRIERAEMEKTINDHADTIEKLMHERKVQDLQIESLNKRLFDKDQQLKVHSDRIKQLQDQSTYRNEVVRLEGVVETNEVELRAVKEDLSTKVIKIQSLEEKLEGKKERKITFDDQTEKIKLLEVKLEQLQEMKENLKSKEEENQQMEEILKQNVIEMKEQEEELKINKEKVNILEENKTFLMNENTVLKNEAKITANQQNNKEEERRQKILPVSSLQTAEDQVLSNKKVREELTDLKNELEKFKEFTFNRFDKIMGNSSPKSSTSDEDTSEDTSDDEQHTDNQQQPQQPPQDPCQLELQQRSEKPPVPAAPDINTDNNVNPGPATDARSKTPWARVSQTTNPSGTGYIPCQKDTTLNSQNKFRSLQFVNNSAPLSTHSGKPSSLPLVPGPNLYSQTVKGYSKKVSIFSTSMTRSMDVKELNDRYGGDRVNLHRFPGKKARHFQHYIPVHMAEDKSDVCVVLAGGNDLPGKTPVSAIANSIIEAGIACKNAGASHVLISSVLPREDFFCQLKRHDLNVLLKDLCVIHNFIFMNSSNMSLRDLCHDGVHLSQAGSDKLQSNFLTYLNA